MFDAIIAYSVRNKLVIGLFVLGLIIWGIFSLRQIPIDAIPDITNNQVQVYTSSPTLATQEVEQFITTPIELSLQNLQGVVEIRSISRFGLSVITVVFEEGMDIYLARQLVNEQLREAESDIGSDLGRPTLAPISTGLGEIYQYVVRPETGYEDRFNSTELRTIQDWIVRRQLAGIEGVAEVNTMGGHLKQYEVAVDPNLLKSLNVSMGDILSALENSNENTGGAYIEKSPRAYYIRTDGLVGSLADIGKIVVEVRDGRPILIQDVATVQFGHAPRYGALVRNGREAVGGRVMMLKGANSAAVTERVKVRVEQIQGSLPEGVVIEPYLVRDKLVSTAIGTVEKNLIEGGLIVVFVLILLLGNWRAGLIVASVIPLAMLFAVSMMNLLGISANLMSLGAIDFGLIVDGAVIIVEAIIHRLHLRFAGRTLTQGEMDEEVTRSSIKIRRSAAFGEIIILMVYLPILALVGIEGKMFRPMAQTVMLAITGALILSLTYVPMVAALVLNKRVTAADNYADRIIAFFQRLYVPVLKAALRFKAVFVVVTVGLFCLSIWVFTRLGGEFIPTLEEGDLAMEQVLPPGTSLSQTIEMTQRIQQRLLDSFPEIEEVVTNLGSAEIPTDPNSVERGDVTLVMKPKEEWTTASTRPAMFAAIEDNLAIFPGVTFEFSQPIQLRTNELITGSKADVAIKLYGSDLGVLYQKAKEAEGIISGIPGVGTINVEQTLGMPQLVVAFDYAKLAQYGLQARDVNRVVRTAFAGQQAGTVYEGDRRFDLTVRLQEPFRRTAEDLAGIYIPLSNGNQVPLREVASVEFVNAPMQISRDNTNRRIVIGVNLGNTDVQTLVANIQSALSAKMSLPVGYYFTYGGQFENLRAASARLAVAVPVALGLIFVLLYFTFGSFAQAALIFVAIPLSAIGGIWALQLRGMPFSISAGIGFIALFGVAVLNGIVLIGYLNDLKQEGVTDVRERILRGARVRLRPVIMTATVASLGFLPMALSNSGGAEVQRPLATVVIGGLISATFLTLVILPILYSWLEHWRGRTTGTGTLVMLIPLLLLPLGAGAQVRSLTLEEAVALAQSNHPMVRAANEQLRQSRSLQHLPYTPGLTDINYNGDGLYRPNGQRVNQVTVIQELNHPLAVRAANAVQDATVTLDLIGTRLTAAALTLEVRQAYYSLQRQQALVRLYGRLVAIYAEYSRIAEARVTAGEANRLEVLNLQSSLNEYTSLLQRARLQEASLRDQLGSLLFVDGPVDAVDTLAPVLVPVFLPDTTAAGALRIQQAQGEVVAARTRLGPLRAELKPSVRLGYSVQRYDEDGILSGVEVGVALPLFTQPTRRRIEAQRLGIVAAETRLEAERQRQRQQRLATEADIRQYAEAIAYYRNQLAVINPEIVRISGLNYRAGENSYLELLNALHLLSVSEQEYINAVGDHNLAVAQLRYLIN